MMVSFDRAKVIEIMHGLQGRVFKKLSPKEESEVAIILATGSKVGHVEILALTEGPGVHEAKLSIGKTVRYEVPIAEVYVTIDNTGFLSGDVSTFILKREESGLIFLRHDLHLRS